MTFLLSLGFDVAANRINICTACGQQTKGPAPEHFLPEELSDLRELLFNQAAAGRLICIDELGEFRVWVAFEENM